MNYTSKRLACTMALLLALAACGGSSDSAPGSSPAPTPAPVPTPNGPRPLVTPVGTAQGNAVSAGINSAGGTLSSADGRLKITVPEGALNALTTLSIQPISNGAPGGVGTAYRLLPEGTQFAKPVQLSFSYSDGDTLGSSAQALDVASQQANGTWRSASAVPHSASHTVTAQTTHFSDWSLVQGFQLRPPKASVKTGATVALRLAYCFAPSVQDDDLTPLGYDCANPDDPVPLNWAVKWAVNGVPGGSTSFGTVSAGSGTSATFTAPGQKPSPSTVAVSAEVQGSKGQVLVVSNITITDTAGYTGTISGTTQTGNMTGKWQSNNLRFIPVEKLPNDLTKYEAQGGSVTLTSQGPGGSVTTVIPLDTVYSTLIVYDPVRGGTSFAGHYWFSMMVLSNVCPEEVAAGGATLPSYGSDPTHLEGSRTVTCHTAGGDTTTSSQWSLQASE